MGSSDVIGGGPCRPDFTDALPALLPPDRARFEFSRRDVVDFAVAHFAFLLPLATSAA
jgi:hypothetical protein